MPIDEAPELYSHIVASVIRSVMLAQREFVLSLVAGKSISDVPNAAVNRHFSWMALEIAEGKNRHLTEPGLNQFPLRTSALRNPKGTPEKILSLLRARKAPDSGVRWKLRSSPQQTGQIDMANVDNYIRFESTRISTLVRASFSEFAQENRSSLTDDDGLVTSSRFAVGSKRLALRDSIMLRSALAIAYDFLTMPGLPATRAYALVSLRNFIFNVCGAVPDISTGWPASTRGTVARSR